LEQAKKLWCDYVATGHYAIIKDHKLYRGKDKTKDQSYFLSRLSQYQLNHALTPLWKYTKPEIRAIAKEIWLPNADRPDSQWLCFIGDIPMSEFLRKKLPEKQWDIIDQTGKKVGIHSWARFYTLGQRHQLFLPFRAYVTAIDVTNNIITVGEKYDEKLTSDIVNITDRVWTGDHTNHDKIKDCLVKIRYRQDPLVIWSCISQKDNNFIFKIEPTRWVTPGQILVAYTQDDQVLWSGIIL
jgi:tRNA-specific 2-thiouridylase